MYKNNQRIRILTVIRHPIGGIRTYLKYTYNNLNKGKYQFTVLAKQHPETDMMKKDLHNLEVKFVEVKRGKKLLSLAYNVFLAMLKGNVDLIHSQGSSAGIIVSSINIIFKIPHIITFHETFDTETISGRFRSLKTKVASFLFSRASYLITVSDDARQNALEYFPNLKKYTDRIIVIYNGVDTDYFQEEIKDLRDVHEIEGIDKDSFVIGYLGRYMPEKGFPVLINAVAKVAEMKPATKFKVLSVGDGAYIREYKAIIKEKGLNEYFVFIGLQPDIRWILREIDLLVIPSLREAFPIIGIEGLIAGTPIVASNCIGLKEVLAGSPALLVDPGDPDALAFAIVKRMEVDSKAQAKEFSVIAREKFDAKVTAGKLENLFERVVSGN